MILLNDLSIFVRHFNMAELRDSLVTQVMKEHVNKLYAYLKDKNMTMLVIKHFESCFYLGFLMHHLLNAATIKIDPSLKLKNIIDNKSLTNLLLEAEEYKQTYEEDDPIMKDIIDNYLKTKYLTNLDERFKLYTIDLIDKYDLTGEDIKGIQSEIDIIYEDFIKIFIVGYLLRDNFYPSKNTRHNDRNTHQ